MLAAEDVLEEAVRGGRDGEHLVQEVRVRDERAVARVARARDVPRVVPRDHARQDHPQRPDVVRGSVVGGAFGVKPDALCGEGWRVRGSFCEDRGT